MMDEIVRTAFLSPGVPADLRETGRFEHLCWAIGCLNCSTFSIPRHYGNARSKHEDPEVPGGALSKLIGNIDIPSNWF